MFLRFNQITNKIESFSVVSTVGANSNYVTFNGSVHVGWQVVKVR